MEHTAKPWELIKFDDNIFLILSPKNAKGNKDIIATVLTGTEYPLGQGNAMLIQNSPALFDAAVEGLACALSLRELSVKFNRLSHIHFIDNSISVIKSAINQAIGQK